MPVASRCFAAIKAAVVEEFWIATAPAMAVQRGKVPEDPESQAAQKSKLTGPEYSNWGPWWFIEAVRTN